MYQQERKERFVNQYVVRETKDTILAMFKTISPYEEKLGKDVSEMSEKELQEVIDNTMAVRTISKYSKFRCLQKYIQWCAASGYGNVTDAYTRIRMDGIDKMRRQFVANPAHLQRTLNQIFDPVDEETVDVIYRCYLWLGFMCFPENKISELTANHLDFDAHKLSFRDNVYPLYQESEPVFFKAATLTEFTYRHTAPDYEIRRSRYLGNGLLRGIKSNFNTYTMRSKITARVKQAVLTNGVPTQEISYKRLDASGIFYSIYTRECAGLPISPKQEFYERFAAHGIQRESAIHIATSYVQDYERWKIAFMK